MSTSPVVSVIGLPINCVDYRGAIDWIVEHARDRESVFAMEAANTHVASLARHEEEFAEVMARFDLIVPDGMPLIWSVNRRLPSADRLTDRVYGPTLMKKTIEATAEMADMRHFFLGGKESTLQKLESYFKENAPDLCIAGSYSPPFGEWSKEEQNRIYGKIRDSDANLIWIGLGCPKQERWIAKHKDELPAGVYFGVGAAFAFHAGEVKQAPALIQKLGLEWAYRMAMEPRRLFKRYLVYNSLFIWYSIIDKLRKNKG